MRGERRRGKNTAGIATEAKESAWWKVGINHVLFSPYWIESWFICYPGRELLVRRGRETMAASLPLT